jgi:hypothetical protein
MLCERCKTEIALANALDAEPDVDRWRRELLVRSERRVLSPSMWALFEALYAGRGHPLSSEFLTHPPCARTGLPAADGSARRPSSAGSWAWAGAAGLSRPA